MPELFWFSGNGEQTHAVLKDSDMTMCGRPINKDFCRYEPLHQPTCRKCRIMRGEDNYRKRFTSRGRS